MTPGVDRSPPETSRRIAVGAGVVAALSVAPWTPGSLVVSAPGVLALAVGLRRGRRDAVSGGAAVLLLGILLGGAAGAPAWGTLLGAGLALLAWDVGTNAIELGRQIGRDAPTREAEIAHASGTAAVGLCAGAAGYALFTVAGGGRPMMAVVLLSFAAVLLATALRLRVPSAEDESA